MIMRVTQSLNQSQFLTALNQIESRLSQTQNQITTNLNFTTAAQNPVAAGLVNNYNQTLTQSTQYDTNGNSAHTNLAIEDSALSQVQTQLQSLRDLALQANNGSLSPDARSAIAAQVVQIQSGILAAANTQNGSGEYIFAGNATLSSPFVATASGAAYTGDQGQREVQIAAGQSVATGDNGDSVFNRIKTGNGTFAATAGISNGGTGIFGATSVTDPAGYDGGTYAINFTAPNSYEVRDSNNLLISSGTFSSGQSIGFRGIQLTLNGQPASGDSFSVAPSANQSVFATVQNLVSALQNALGTPAAQALLNNSIGYAINNIDQALNQISNVRSAVGGRLNSITAEQSLSGSQQIQLQQSISNLQSLDYAKAITTLTEQNTTLSASMQAYALTKGLTLFKYL
jgi:flagellar hook-associated protein 3 FlgL